jgi:hypothetical protein
VRSRRLLSLWYVAVSRRVAVRRWRATRFGLLAWFAVTSPFVFAASEGTALASTGWQPPTVLAPPTQVYGAPVNVAIDAEGNALAVWAAPGSSGNEVVLSSYRRAGSDHWPAPQTLGESRLFVSDKPAVAFDAAGNVIVAWVGPAARQIMASTRSATAGRWTPATQVSPPGEGSAFGPPLLGVDAAGDAVLTWTAGTPPSCCVGEVSYRPAGGNWHPPTKLRGGPAGLAVASDGSMLLTYLDGDVVDAITGVSGAWDAPVDLGHERGNFWPPAAAIAPGGDAAVAWTTEEHGNNIVYGAARIAGAWQPAQPLSFVDGQAWPGPNVGIDARGDMLATFDTDFDVDASFRPAGAAWERPVLVSPRIFLPGSNLVMNAAGQAVAYWLWSEDILGTVNTAFPLAVADYTPGIGWEPAQTLDPNTGGDASAAVAIDPAGDPIAVWEHNEPDGSAIENAILDAGGPLLHAVFNHARPRISGSARPGRKLRCATGTWSGAPPISFRFRWLRRSHFVGSMQTYRVTRADSGSWLTCHVTATNTFARSLSARGMYAYCAKRGETFDWQGLLRRTFVTLAQARLAHVPDWTPRRCIVCASLVGKAASLRCGSRVRSCVRGVDIRRDRSLGGGCSERDVRQAACAVGGHVSGAVSMQK